MIWRRFRFHLKIKSYLYQQYNTWVTATFFLLLPLLIFASTYLCLPPLSNASRTLTALIFPLGVSHTYFVNPFWVVGFGQIPFRINGMLKIFGFSDWLICRADEFLLNNIGFTELSNKNKIGFTELSNNIVGFSETEIRNLQFRYEINFCCICGKLHLQLFFICQYRIRI